MNSYCTPSGQLPEYTEIAGKKIDQAEDLKADGT